MRALGVQTMRVLILLLAILYSAICLGNDAKWDVYVQEDGWAALTKSPSGEYSLASAISSIPKDVWLKHFRVFPTEQNKKMQAELHKYLAAQYPRIQAEALASAGNMHNPKIKALRGAFKEAILATTMVKSLNAALEAGARCERIASTSFEKFHIKTKETGQPVYGAMVWLTTEKCT